MSEITTFKDALDASCKEWEYEIDDVQFAYEIFEIGFSKAWKYQQCRITQLETELAAAKLSKLDKENLEIGRQLQRAANDLPDLFNIEIDVENGCAGVTLINEDGDRRSFILDEHLSFAISEAIDAAIKDGQKIAQDDCEEEPCSFCFSRDCNGTCISGLDN